MLRAEQHLQLGLLAGIAEFDAHHEAIELRLWQWKGTRLILRVLGGDDKEGGG